jgi:hypothetical protein
LNFQNGVLNGFGIFNLDAYFGTEEFRLSNAAHPKPILPLKSLSLDSVPVISTDPTVVNMWRPLMKRWRTMQMPSKIGLQLTKPFPAECRSEQFQVYAWKVYSPPNKSIFVPRNTKIYFS